MSWTPGSQERESLHRLHLLCRDKEGVSPTLDYKAGRVTLHVSFQNGDTIYLMCHV